MSRETHVRICGRLEVRFLRSTRRAPRSCATDEGRSLGVALQEEASNHLKLLWSKAMVVSVKEKVPPQTGSVVNQRDERKRTIR